MDGSGQDNDATPAGEQPHLHPAVRVLSGHVLFDSAQARVDGILRYARQDGHQDMIRNQDDRIGGLFASRGGEATRTLAVASDDTDGSVAAADEQEQPHPLPAGTPGLAYEHGFFDGYLILFRTRGSGHGDMNNGYGDDAYRGGGFGAVPASDDEIARLEKATVGDTREAECVVCMESFKEGDEIRKMPCSHGFHEACIFTWLRVSRLCPHCRFAMPADDNWL